MDITLLPTRFGTRRVRWLEPIQSRPGEPTSKPADYGLDLVDVLATALDGSGVVRPRGRTELTFVAGPVNRDNLPLLDRPFAPIVRAGSSGVLVLTNPDPMHLLRRRGPGRYQLEITNQSNVTLNHMIELPQPPVDRMASILTQRLIRLFLLPSAERLIRRRPVDLDAAKLLLLTGTLPSVDRSSKVVIVGDSEEDVAPEDSFEETPGTTSGFDDQHRFFLWGRPGKPPFAWQNSTIKLVLMIAAPGEAIHQAQMTLTLDRDNSGGLAAIENADPAFGDLPRPMFHLLL